MIYATVAAMVARFGELEIVQLTDRDNIPPSVVDVARVETKLADASAFVDGYVGQVYQLPLLGCAKPDGAGGVSYVPPPVLERICCDLARYYLHDDLAPENEVYRRYKGALRELDAVASGQAMLACPWGGSPGVPLSADAQSGGGDTYHKFSSRSITDDSMRGFA